MGGGLTIGAGVGGGFSLQATNTVVTPNTLTLNDFIPNWLQSPSQTNSNGNSTSSGYGAAIATSLLK